MATRVRTYYAVPSPVVGYPLSGARISVVVPLGYDLTNIILNPSIETNTTGYLANGAGTIERYINGQRRGAYSLKVTPGVQTTAGMLYTPITLVSNLRYPWSFDFWGNSGLAYKAYVASTAFVVLSSTFRFKAIGAWQRLQLDYIEQSGGGARYLYIVKDGDANVKPFYVDGMLMPNLVSDMSRLKYFDGDSLGTTPARTDFFWNGTPHGSMSTMIAQSRTAGRIVDLSIYGFVLLALMGLNGTPVNNVGVPLALVGGEQYQRTVKQARIFDLVGTIAQSSPVLLKSYLKSLRVAFDADIVSDQLMHLQYQSMNDCGEAVGNVIDIPCKYVGGLEGNRDNPYQEQLDIKFKAYLPIAGVLDGSEGGPLDVRDSLTNANRIVRRDRNGIWQQMQTGLNNNVLVALWLPDGRALIGGAFTDAGGVANADYLTIYDPTTDTFSALNATPLNDSVWSMLLLPDGTVALGGRFSDAGGVANADYLARLNLTTGAFTAFNATPLTGGFATRVESMALLPNGDIALGGDFTNAGGDANADFLARMNGTTFAFSAFTTTPLSQIVNAVEVGGNNNLYIGGAFTNAGGIAEADFFTWLVSPAYDAFQYDDKRIPTLSANVYTIRKLSDGSVFVGGIFADVDGVADWDYALVYNGGGFQQVINSVNGAVYKVEEIAPGVYMLSGSFTSINGVALYDYVAVVSGNTVIPMDINLPSAPIVQAIAASPGQGLIIGYTTSGTAYTSGTSTLTNSGTAKAYPVIVISHPTTATVTAPLRSIRNLTTRDVISFNLTLLIGETVTIDTSRKTVTSNIRGNLYGTILPGSNFATFHLASGANRINIFSTVTAGDVPTAYAYWTPAYDAVEDAEY